DVLGHARQRAADRPHGFNGHGASPPAAYSSAMHKTLFSLLVLALAVPQSRPAPRSATDVTSAEIQAVVKLAPAEGVMDQQIRVVDMGKYNVAVGVLHRSAKGKQSAIDHAQVTEVYHIIDGSGTFVTGGTMVDASPADPNGTTVKVLVGPSTNGASIRG